jgi:hypothetical protein
MACISSLKLAVAAWRAKPSVVEHHANLGTRYVPQALLREEALDNEESSWTLSCITLASMAGRSGGMMWLIP